MLIEAKEQYKIILMTGGGTRARHVYNIGVDLGMPTGVLSKLGDKVSWQNAEMLSVLLSKHGGVKIGHGDNLEQLTMFCRLGYLPITYGIPPYGFSNTRRSSVPSLPIALTAELSCWRKISAPAP